MATAARFAQGTLLKIGDGAGPEVFTTVAEVKNIAGPQLSAEAKEATSHDSSAGFREYIYGLLSGGQVTLTVNWLPANATQSYSSGILKDMTSRLVRNYSIVFPSAAPLTWKFAAIVTQFHPQAPVDGILEVQIQFQITGAPTLA